MPLLLTQQGCVKPHDNSSKKVSMLQMKMWSFSLDQVHHPLCSHTASFDLLGSTSAINKLVEVLQLRNEAVRKHTVVFFSTIEHHSNILPWTETGVEVSCHRRFVLHSYFNLFVI